MRVIVSILGVFCLLITSVGFAKSEHHATKPSVQQKVRQVVVYTAPHLNANIVQKVSPAKRLVPIFRQGEWIKIGDPSNGKVGWINREQYRQAMRAFYRPNMQMVFIRTEHNNNGKPTINVVAYKNGKKLTQEQADKIYKHIQKEQMRESRYAQRMFWNMDRFMDQQVFDMNHFMMPWNNMGFDFGPEIIQPVIVVNPAQQPAALIKHKKSKK